MWVICLALALSWAAYKTLENDDKVIGRRI